MTSIPAPLRRLEVPAAVLDASRQLLAEPGREGFEASVVWPARALDDTAARVIDVWRPAQVAHRTIEGVCVEITPDGMSEIIAALPAGAFLAARLHTHPGEAYHSAVDDLNMLIGHHGAISIVVPRFAREPIDLRRCSVNELRHGVGWIELTSSDVAERFRVI